VTAAGRPRFGKTPPDGDTPTAAIIPVYLSALDDEARGLELAVVDVAREVRRERGLRLGLPDRLVVGRRLRAPVLRRLLELGVLGEDVVPRLREQQVEGGAAMS